MLSSLTGICGALLVLFSWNKINHIGSSDNLCPHSFAKKCVILVKWFIMWNCLKTKEMEYRNQSLSKLKHQNWILPLFNCYWTIFFKLWTNYMYIYLEENLPLSKRVLLYQILCLLQAFQIQLTCQEVRLIHSWF